MGRMHAANVDRSERLQAVDKFLDDGQEHSTLEIILVTGVCAVNSAIDELRDNGRNIPPARREGRVYYYRKIKEAA